MSEQFLDAQTSNNKCKTKHQNSLLNKLMCISIVNAKIAHHNNVNQCDHASCEEKYYGVLTAELSLTQF